MDQTLEKNEQLDEAQCGSSNFSLSTNFEQQCRFIVLGGDELAKSDACRFILRTAQTQQVQRTNLGICEMKENNVLGRHVCVVNSPFFWMDRLASSMFFHRRLKEIKNEMYNCVSLVFPGPHAFLLVIRVGTGKEHYLLKAIASVFGKEAIDYSMVVFIAGSDKSPGMSTHEKQKCLLMCKDRYHLLQDTDESIQELFQKVEDMISMNKNKFFIPSKYEKFTTVNFESWEKERIDSLSAHMDTVHKLSKEVKDLEVTNQNLKMENENMSQLRESTQNVYQQRENELMMDLETSQQRESKLRMELDTSQQRESKLRMELDTSQQRESKLRMELDTSQQRAREQIMHLEQREKDLRKELDAAQQRERDLKKDLEGFQGRESKLREEGRWRDVESEQREPQATETQLVRSSSKDQIYPTFSRNQDDYLEPT